MSDFARNIKRRRAERGMSQEQLAEKLGVTRQTVSNWERSDSRRRHGLHILRFPASGKAQSFRRSSFPHEKHASRVVEIPRIRFAAAA